MKNILGLNNTESGLNAFTFTLQHTEILSHIIERSHTYVCSVFSHFDGRALRADAVEYDIHILILFESTLLLKLRFEVGTLLTEFWAASSSLWFFHRCGFSRYGGPTHGHFTGLGSTTSWFSSHFFTRSAGLFRFASNCLFGFSSNLLFGFASSLLF